ncbi:MULTISPECIES: HlyD family secretion protein [Pseudomonas]|uniref:HlyD family secretion protein n=3 Tax=Pseudomonas chlororaphis TaxID=587753 RepID=A0AAQ0APY6_9PSED|nr:MULTISPECIES: HlyD family secretion protein [Pseudomonas]AIC17329.1 DSBA oxidoreductase [Pseudomonas chlororaphis]AUG38457.1 HlyD family secretion protein [Pseudomonas chlororaphis]AZD83016.1 Membrane fusion component of MSF-type tripartite multidrug efflux system [Pseudomonas chlororaphis subsp. aureofaciens]AZD96057.1 Membrane fusion component of MSF-type tripartite multidrug efflux system [Pseudomonas chlororaphis subsp. aureofaciens]AZE02351.1 Membrane fusion component of MSF-type tripa
MTIHIKHKIAVSVAAVAVLGVLVYLVTGKATEQTTNDAFVSADYTLVAPRVAGFIKEVLVEDNQRVKAGQLLALIDDRDLRAAAQAADAETLVAKAQLQNARATLDRQSSVIAQAQASVVAARAEMAFAEHELNRYNHLAGVGAGTVQNAQQARTRIDQASARLATATAALAAERKQVEILTAQRDAAEGGLKRAQAALEMASYELSYTRIVAPVDGMVGERAVRVGAYVTPGSKILAVVPLEQAYVVANFQETQLARMHPGQPVAVRVDSLDGETLRGRVESLAPATGVTFAAVKPDNATGNFTKVVQRIPVKILLEPGQPMAERLRVGMSVEASVDTLGKASSVREVAKR